MAPSIARTQYRELVAEIAAKAKARLPEQVNGRIEAAARLVVNGDVEQLGDGTIKVGGSDPTRWYHLVGATCTCTDFVQGKAPDGWCKHRIAAGIAKGVGELLPQDPAPAPPAGPLPEAPASVNCHLMIEGRQVQLTLCDTDEGRLLARLQAVLQQYPMPQAQPSAPQDSSQGQGQDGFCLVHGVTMKQTTKDGRSWWPHRTADGWCKGRK
jgi:hypothetical protein